jgi:hypothetical protein
MDWDFDATFDAVSKTVSMFKQQGIAHSFLIDCGVDSKGHPEYLKELLLLIAQSELSPTYFVNKTYRVYFFAPSIRQTLSLCASLPDAWEKFFVAYITGDLHTPVSEFNRYRRLWKKFTIPVAFIQRHGLLDISGETPLGELFSRLGYVQFWGGEGKTVAMNGHIPVMPGYNDLRLQRKPQSAPMVPRRDGHTLVEQFRAATASGAGTILIYSWNEYFEDTQIEPTLEYGDFYLELTRRLIAQIKNNEPVHFPEDMDMPKPAPVLYLTPELEDMGQREPDGVPRWDKYEYVAELGEIAPPDLENGHAVFRDITVYNAGTKPWPVASATIRLGVRLVDKDGSTLREGRAELGSNDVATGAMVETDIRLDLAGLEDITGCTALFGVVWENKFWLDGERKLSLCKKNA